MSAAGILIAGTVATLTACPPAFEFASGRVIGTIQSGKVTEASGIAVSSLNPGVLWTHNDGPRDKVYAFRMDGTLLATYALVKSPLDVEEIALGPGPVAGASYLYVADIGSNSADRNSVRIYRVREPNVDPAWATNAVSRDLKNVETFTLTYPDGATFDAEAILLDSRGGMLYLLTKERFGARLYRVPLSELADGKTVTLEFARVVDFPQASSAAVSPDGTLVAVRQEDFALVWPRVGNEPLEQAFDREPMFIPVIGRPAEPNGEAIAFLPDGSGYVTLSEGPNQPLYFFEKIVHAPEAPRFLSNPRQEQDGLHLEFAACNGMRVTIERSANLRDWASVGTVTVTGETGSFVDPTRSGPRFYRLKAS